MLGRREAIPDERWLLMFGLDADGRRVPAFGRPRPEVRDGELRLGTLIAAAACMVAAVCVIDRKGSELMRQPLACPVQLMSGDELMCGVYMPLAVVS